MESSSKSVITESWETNEYRLVRLPLMKTQTYVGRRHQCVSLRVPQQPIQHKTVSQSFTICEKLNDECKLYQSYGDAEQRRARTEDPPQVKKEQQQASASACPQGSAHVG